MGQLLAQTSSRSCIPERKLMSLTCVLRIISALR